MKIVTKKTIKKECWNLDYELVKWINQHFKTYYNEAIKNIDLSYYKFKYKGTQYTQEQIIVLIIEITGELLNKYFYQKDNNPELVKEMYDLLKLVHWTMWL